MDLLCPMGLTAQIQRVIGTNMETASQESGIAFAELAKKSHSPNARRFLPQRKQALELQAALHHASIALSKDVKDCKDKELRARIVSAMASAAKGWDSVSDRLRILIGKPSPGTLKPVSAPSKPRVKSAPKPAPLPDPGSVKNSDS